MSSSQRYLQRHQPGLPVIARNEKGALALFQEDEAIDAWGRISLDDRPDEREGERFDATLEAFVGGRRLDASDILDQGFENLLGEDRFQLRLVINHNDSGDPFDIPAWSAERISFVPRPTLPETQGAALWTLAEHLPCEEHRYFVCDTEGCWQVERVVSQGERPAEVLPEPEPVEDRYSAMARSLTTRPVARPFAIASSGVGKRVEGLGVYRIR